MIIKRFVRIIGMGAFLLLALIFCVYIIIIDGICSFFEGEVP